MGTDGVFWLGYFLGILVVVIVAVVYTPNHEHSKLGEEVQKIIKVCEETLPRNEKCTFLIAPESKLLIEE